MTGGSTSRSFTPPFSGDAVLYLVDAAGHAGAASGTRTTYSDTSLTANTSYSYRVRAVDAAGNLSAYSNVASATTPGTDYAAADSARHIDRDGGRRQPDQSELGGVSG